MTPNQPVESVALSIRHWFTAKKGKESVTSDCPVDAGIGLAWMMDLPKDVWKDKSPAVRLKKKGASR